jgi:hypothetical protein
MQGSAAVAPLPLALPSLLPHSKVRAKVFPWWIVPDFVPLELKNRYFPRKVMVKSLPIPSLSAGRSLNYVSGLDGKVSSAGPGDPTYGVRIAEERGKSAIWEDLAKKRLSLLQAPIGIASIFYLWRILSTSHVGLIHHA